MIITRHLQFELTKCVAGALESMLFSQTSTDGGPHQQANVERHFSKREDAIFSIAMA